MTTIRLVMIIKTTAEYKEGALSVGVVYKMNVTELPFEQLVEKFEPLIKKQIKQLNQTVHYDELYQIGLIALWEASKNFDETKGYFPSFAQKYVRGKMLHHLKKEQTFQQRFQIYLEPESVEKIPAQEFQKQRPFPLERIVPLLSKTERIWFVEYYENDIGPTAIAKQYNVPVDTVKKWRKRAIERIRSNLKTSELLDLVDF